MRHIKSYKIFESESKFHVGDMVYVYNKNGYLNNDNSKFNDNTQYEIINIENDNALIFDESNNPVEVEFYRLKFIILDYQYISDCLISSFESIFNLNKGLVEPKSDGFTLTINYYDKINMAEFDNIYYNEFIPRIKEMGYNSTRNFSGTNGIVSPSVKICVFI